MINAFLGTTKDIIICTGIGALYSVQMHIPQMNAKILLGTIAISRLANRILLECVRYSTQNGEGGVKLANRYAFTNATVNLMTIVALRNFQFIGTKGATFLVVLALLNISRIKTSNAL
ncbi:MAG: hypothetical protein H0V82_07960 [Candidatus Protochlamydia sp.]|nr:hypothetical protein [Candidatus Protochlamydia sp.]